MPVYNGEPYIKEQLDSILTQLKSEDELIIIDDSSIDRTIEIIKSYKSSNISIIFNERNQGILKSIKKGILNATKPIVVFVDQDDIWIEGKLDKIRSAFEGNITMYLQDGLMIDKSKKLLTINPISWVDNYGGTLFDNLIKNTFLGCCMSFRLDFLIKHLDGLVHAPMHDYYFGILILIYRKKYKIGDEISFLFRRHDSNQTPKSTTLAKKITIRVKLVKALLIDILKIEI